MLEMRRETSAWLPFGRRQRLHAQCMDFLAHPVAERPIHELVTRDQSFAFKRIADNGREKMLAVAFNFQMLASEAASNVFLHLFRGRQHGSLQELVTQFVTACQQPHGDQREHDENPADNAETRERTYVGHAEEAISKAIDHVEKRI